MRWAWPVAIAALAGTVVLVLAGAVLAVLTPTRTTIVAAAVGGLLAALSAGIGTVIAHRARANVVGALLALVGLTLALSSTREIGWRVLAERPAALADLDWLVALLAESSIWLLVALALLLVFFPDGRVPGPRWRLVPPVLVMAALVHQGYGAVSPVAFRPPLQALPRPFGPPPAAIELLALVADVAVLVLVIASAASLVVKFRSVDEVRRRQLKWLALAGIGVPGFIVICLGELVVLGRPWWISAIVGIATLAGVPIAVGIAVLRYDLYDVDRALATTLAYAASTSVLVAIYAAASAGAGVVLGRESTVVAAAVTAVSALVMSPLRRGLQRRVDRRLSPLRHAAWAAIEDLHRSIHVGEARPEQLEARLQVALRDPGLRIGYLTPGGQDLVDDTGAPLQGAPGVPVVTGDTTIGALLPSSATIPPDVLQQVAAAAATLVELVRLRLELTAALRDVERSRARLVQAGDDERRRLERDLHDGAQQRLVALGMALRVAQRHLGDDATDVDGLLDQTVAELATAVAELRQIAHGLRPSSLDDGLHAALTAVTQHVPIPVGLDVPADPLPDDIVTTVYYVASEAIANAVKHADATRVDVQIVRSNGAVEVRVADDGQGGAAVTAGSGLAGLDDRVSAVGGVLRLHSTRGRGTIVEAVVPCAS